MQQSDLEKLFNDFKGLKVLIVGDVMVDSYIIGKVDRVSPEAPVPVVDVQKFDSRLGGAGNVALNIQALGAEPVLCSVIGNDKEGQDLCTLLSDAGLSQKSLLLSEKRKTTTKTRILGNGHQLIRIDHEITTPLDTLDSFLLEQHFERELEQADVVILEDYNKGVLHAENIKSLIDKAKKAGVPVVVDPKKENFLNYVGATFFKPNLKELGEGIHISENLKEIPNLEKAVSMLNESLHCDMYMITMSEKGVFLKDETNSYHIPAHFRNITDVSGAGDTVISVAALCVALKTDHKLLAEISNLAGGLVCEETGVVPINRERLMAEAMLLLGS
ncbi:MAG: D-glycero-beta-D-manno-heptose-7-phosphate kinase [Bacteroidetes bacterium]|nr:D-glycero-beta-D-manno-heptose-7-phosphate kinase [Bacteroidota bacterium]